MARRSILILLAGVVWSAVGLVLVAAALRWLLSADESIVLTLLSGVAAGVIIYRFGFWRLIRANLDRIQALGPGKETVCIFAFQAWRSYLIIPVMMLFGYALRQFPVPRIYAAVIYLAIGVGLFLASLHYYPKAKRSARNGKS